MIAMRCAACGERFVGGRELRDIIWPHAETHDPSEFPPARNGGYVAFEGEPFILSCNCGECDHCSAAPTPHDTGDSDE